MEISQRRRVQSSKNNAFSHREQVLQVPPHTRISIPSKACRLMHTNGRSKLVSLTSPISDNGITKTAVESFSVST